MSRLRKIIALVALGGIVFGLYSWFDNWFYFGRGTDGPGTVRYDICHIKRGAAVAGGKRRVEQDVPAVRKPDPPSRAKRPYVLMEVTAYSYTGNRTTSGKWPRPGMCAIDPQYFKFGTRFYVEGYGFVVAEDTGRLIKGIKPGQRNAKGEPLANMDLFMEDEREAARWGRPVVKVYVYN